MPSEPLGIARLGVELGERSYCIAIGSGLLEELPNWMNRNDLSASHLLVVADATVEKHYGDTLRRSLGKGAWRLSFTRVPAGEASKNLDILHSLWQWMQEERADRGSVVIAVGGGVIGDLVGLAASTYARGLRMVQIPTTLLAQVDSSVGGKTGINLGEAKNAVGTFWQPRLVLIDVATLQTLPDREFRSGLAEVIKYGVIMNAGFFGWLESNLERILQRELEPLRDMIYQCCRCKADVVGEDERETSGRRAILNYGHTFGHAIEAATGYATYLHGEAIAIGMTCAAKVAVRLELCPRSLLDRQTELLERCGLPTELGGLDPDRLIELMKHDKKVYSGRLHLVLPRAIGHVEVTAEVELKPPF